MAAARTRNMRKLVDALYLPWQQPGGTPMRVVSVVALATLFAVPAFATENISVGHFSQVQLRGGGHVVIKHGASQSVTLLKGSTKYTRFHIRDGRELVIDACNN